MTTTNKVRPGDIIEQWDGDLTAKMHIHKPGVDGKPGKSMGISVAQVVGAVQFPEAVGGVETGAVLMMPSGIYPEYLECGGGLYSDSVAPELAVLLKAGTSGQRYSGYNADSEVRSTAGTSVEITHAVQFKGYTFYKTPTAGNLIVAIDSLGAVVYTGTTTVSSDLYATENAVYFVSSGSLYSITVTDGVFKAQYTGESTSSFAGVATISDTEDLYMLATGLARLFNPIAKISRAVSFAGGASLSGTYVSLVGVKGRRIYAASTINTIPGLYEIKFDSVKTELSAELLMATNPAFSVLAACKESSVVYFGVNGLQYKLDVAGGNIAKVTPPLFSSFTASLFKSYALDNFAFFTSNTGANAAYMSFDGGRTWVSTPAFNTKLALAFIDEVTHELVTVGSAGSLGAVKGGTGNIQKNLLTLMAADQFLVPKIKTTADGYKYYVKK